MLIEDLSYHLKCFLGTIPGMISLKNSAEVKYIRLEFTEELTFSGLEEKPLGVRFVQFYGCSLGDTLEACGTHSTRVSSSAHTYRHVGYVINYRT